MSRRPNNVRSFHEIPAETGALSAQLDGAMLARVMLGRTLTVCLALALLLLAAPAQAQQRSCSFREGDFAYVLRQAKSKAMLDCYRRALRSHPKLSSPKLEVVLEGRRSCLVTSCGEGQVSGCEAMHRCAESSLKRLVSRASVRERAEAMASLAQRTDSLEVARLVAKSCRAAAKGARSQAACSTLLVDALMRHERWNEAADELEKQLGKRLPAAVKLELQGRLVQVHRKRGNDAAANELLVQLARAEGTTDLVRARLAKALAEGGAPDEAKKLLGPINERLGTRPNAALLLAVLDGHGAVADQGAIERLEQRALAEKSTRCEVAAWLGSHHARAGLAGLAAQRYELAVGCLDAGPASEEGVRLLLSWGDQLLAAGAPEKAMAVFLRARRLAVFASEAAPASSGVALALAALGERVAAQDALVAAGEELQLLPVRVKGSNADRSLHASVVIKIPTLFSAAPGPPPPLSRRGPPAKSLLLNALPLRGGQRNSHGLSDVAMRPVVVRLRMAEAEVRLGNYEGAKKLYQAAIAKQKASSPLDRAQLLAGLSAVELRLRSHAQARTHIAEAERLLRSPGASPVLVATVASIAVAVDIDERRYDQARARQEKVLEALSPRLGNVHPLVLDSLHNLVVVKRDSGDVDGALVTARDLLERRTQALGSRHPDVAFSHLQIAVLQALKGDAGATLSSLEKSDELTREQIALSLRHEPEARRVAYLSSIGQHLHGAISLHASLGLADSRLVQRTLGMVLQRKAIAVDSTALTLQAARRQAQESSALKEVLASTRAGREKLSACQSRLVPCSPQDVTQLKARLESRAAELALEASRFAKPWLPEPSQVVEAIVADATLLEYIQFRPFRKGGDKWGEPHYGVYVVPPGGAKARFVDLGLAAPIDTLTGKLLQQLSSPEGNAHADTARRLDELVLGKVEALLEGRPLVFIAPDGALNLLPFGALVAKDGRYRAERHVLSLLTSGRDLIRPQATQSPKEPVVLADPEFEREEDGSYRYPPLPGTGQEAAALQKLYPEVVSYVGEAATKDVLFELHGPRFLHVATHGYFLGSTGSGDGTRGLELADAGGAAPIDNPMTRAGLVLSGEGARARLTALEATGLDLSGTQLVVLSACETGVGELKAADSVYGLRRAMVLAGAQTLVTSLWKVDDLATRDLMVRYYESLDAGQGRAEALRTAQLSLIQDDERSHPYYWAAFISSGDYKNLEGKHVPVRLGVSQTPSVDPLKVQQPAGCGCRVGRATPVGFAMTVLVLFAGWARRRA